MTDCNMMLGEFEERARSLGHADLNELLTILERDDTQEEIAADNEAARDAKRFRAIMLTCDDDGAQKVADTIEFFDDGESEERTTSTQVRAVTDELIEALEAAGYTI